MSRLLILLLTASLLACEDDSGLWIDNRCDEDQVDMIYSGVEKINKVLGDSKVIVSGTAKSPPDPLNDDNKDMVICYPVEAEWCPPTMVGSYLDGEIRMYGCRFVALYGERAEEAWLTVFLHELAHYVGVEGHLDETGVVMSSGVSHEFPQDYTEADVDFILEELR